MATTPLSESHLDPLEQHFLRVEQESEERARAAASEEARAKECVSRPSSSHSAVTQRSDMMDKAAKARRRGSISITKFGQLQVEDVSSEKSLQSVPSSPTRVSRALSSSPFYQKHGGNISRESFASVGSNYLDDVDGDMEHDHITQMHTIAPKQSLSKAVSSRLIPRRLSRVQSAAVIRPNHSPVLASVRIKETSTSTEAANADADDRRIEISAGGRRRMTVSGITPTLAPVVPARTTSHVPPVSVTPAPPAQIATAPSNAGTVQSTTSSLQTESSTEKDKEKSNKVSSVFGFTKKFRRRSKQDTEQTTSKGSP